MIVLWFAVLSAAVCHMVGDDVRHRRIANTSVLVFSALVVGIIVFRPGAIAGGSWWFAAGVGMAALAIGVALYAAGSLAGGDVKLLFGLGALLAVLGSDALLVYLGVLILIGVATAVWYLRSNEMGRKAGIPLAPLLLLGVPPSVAVALFA